MMKMISIIAIALLASIGMSCNLPRDTRDSFDYAKSHALKVGVVDNPPFSRYDSDSIRGTEIKMIEEFAQKEGLEVEFIPGSESSLVERMKEAEIHVLVGGFEKKTVWKEKTGKTRPYDGKHIWLIPKGENKLVYKLESYLHTIKKP